MRFSFDLASKKIIYLLPLLTAKLPKDYVN